MRIGYYGTLAQQDVPAGGGYPVIESITPTAFTSNVTAHNVAMPNTVNSGDLLLVLWVNDDSDTVSATGFTKRIESAYSTFVSHAVMAKIAAGTEGGTTVNFATGSTEQAAAQVYRISNWGGTLLSHVVCASAVTLNGQNPDPPALTSGFGAVPTLWICMLAQSWSQSTTTTPSGSNYTNLLKTGNTTGSTNAAVFSCYKFATAASDNPGTWDQGTTDAYSLVNTIAIRGA